MLEGLGAILNDHMEKAMFYHSFPSKYTKHFRDTGKILADMTKINIVAYFDTLYLGDKKSEAIPRKPKTKSTSDDGDGKENDPAKSCNKHHMPRGGRGNGGCNTYNGGHMPRAKSTMDTILGSIAIRTATVATTSRQRTTALVAMAATATRIKIRMPITTLRILSLPRMQCADFEIFWPDIDTNSKIK